MLTMIEDTSQDYHPLSQVTVGVAHYVTFVITSPIRQHYWDSQLTIMILVLKLLLIDHSSTKIGLRNYTLILILTLITYIYLSRSDLSIGGLSGTSAPGLVFLCGCRYTTRGGQILLLPLIWRYFSVKVPFITLTVPWQKQFGAFCE